MGTMHCHTCTCTCNAPAQLYRYRRRHMRPFLTRFLKLLLRLKLPSRRLPSLTAFSMALANATSPSLTKLVTVPRLPCLPVRPDRCMKSTALLAKSSCTTCLTRVVSRPLDAISVHTTTSSPPSVLPNSSRQCSLSCGGTSLQRGATFTPAA